MEIFAAAGAGFVFGALHGLGPDHCAALASLIAHDTRARETMRASFQFGLGHAAALGALGLLAGATGFLIPESWESAAEVFAGLLLVVVGALALFRRDAQLVIHRHAHSHDHAAGAAHTHWHAHVGRALAHVAWASHGAHGGERRHRHPHAATLVGGAFGLSGVRALTLALPPLVLAAHSVVTALVFVAGFGAGVTFAMAAFGLVFGATRRLAPAETPWVARAVGAVAIALGVFWVARNLTDA